MGTLPPVETADDISVAEPVRVLVTRRDYERYGTADLHRTARTLPGWWRAVFTLDGLPRR